jgi:hypothetical protein
MADETPLSTIYKKGGPGAAFFLLPAFCTEYHEA